ncbi:GntR family transcriptional regulator [Enterococcus sp. LJL98]
MIFDIDEQRELPIYKQIQQQIILGIATQKLFPGEQLPSIRQLSDELGINPMTISKAYARLKTDGYLQTDRRKGTTITFPRPFDPLKKENYLEKLTLILADGFLHQEDTETILLDVKKVLANFEKERDKK